MNSIHGKVAVVVGGGSGIGLAIAKSLRQGGAVVAIGGRREVVLRSAASEHELQFKTIDVASRTSTQEFFAWVRGELGEVDILVFAAGINIKNRSMAEMDPAQWDYMMAINATGAYNSMYEVLPSMRHRKAGLIVNISSVAGKRAIALGGIAYAASKFALTALGTTIANEVAPDGVRVTNVYPGEVNTAILDNRPSPVTEEHRQSILQPDDVAQLVLSIVNLPPHIHVPEVVIKPLAQGWY